MRNSQQTKQKRGFTVVEALVALGILTVGLSAGFAAVSLSLRQSTFSKEQVTAFYLAQEAVEMVRYRRDTNSLAGTTHWLAGLAEQASDPCGDGKICRVDAVNSGAEWATCIGGWNACPVLRKHDTNHWYTYYTTSDTTPTKFARAIQITPISILGIPDGDVVQVEVRITWVRPNSEVGSYTVISMLYDLR